MRETLIRVRRFLKRFWVPLTVRYWPLARSWYRVWGLNLDGNPDDKVWYFAYGANLHDDVFRKRRKMCPIDFRVAHIKGYRLRFNLEGRPKGKAAPANISEDQSSVVWGVLYLISQRDMIWLNATEGVPGWVYQPIWLVADDENGKPIPAFTYMAVGRETDGKPSRRYINLLREGARAHRLPQKWVALLDEIEPAR